MQHRAALVATLASTLLLAACDDASVGQCDAVTQDAFRGKSLNGKSLNGKSLNGKSLNGKSLNGKSLNGESLEGVAVTGLRLAATTADADALADVELVGTALVGTTAAGTRIAGQDWIGASIPARFGDEIVGLRIAAVERDLEDPTLEWYALELEGTPLCESGRGLLIPGVWDETGARHETLADAPEIAHTFSCDDGVLAKCIDWGYAPHTAGIAAHQTCTRLARADYCGDGTPHTVDGTVIDVFDTLGVQATDPTLPLAFEAGWGPDGALCVAQQRWIELGTDGEEVPVSCWDDLPACDTIAQATSAGATLMNRSAPQTLCHE